MKPEVVVNRYGQVMEPKLHDGRLVGIMLSDDEARLYVTDISGKKHTLVLRSVERLRLADFREGNIILDVVVRTCGARDHEALKHLFDVGTTDRDAEFWTKLLTRLDKDERLLVEVNPSYGCSLVALCRKVEVEQ